MSKLVALTLAFLVLATVILVSDGEVTIPFPSDSLIPSTGLNSFCTVKNETFIGWFKGDVKIGVVPSRNDVKDKPAVVVTDVNAMEKSCVLIFPKGTPISAGGRYKCKGSKNEAFLDVLVRFSLDSLQRKQSLHLGRIGKIVLGAYAYPVAKFQWKKDGTPIDFTADSNLKLESDGSITITIVRKSDDGTYDVNINWEKRTIVDEKIIVNVIEKPRFLSTPKPTKLTGVAGFDYEFCCNDTGIPKPTLKWYKVQGATEVEVDVTNARYSVYDKCMSIKTLESSDVAAYKCTSSNIAGVTSANVEIEKVGVKPTVDAFKEDSLIKSLKKPLDIECNGTGEPLPTMEWIKDGKAFAYQKKEQGKSTMWFVMLKLTDSGNYTCTAKNGLIYNNKELSDSKHLQLDVIAKPLLNSDGSPSKVYSFVGNPNSVLIQCVFYGYPDPSVEITKNGSQLANGTTIANLNLITRAKGQFGDYVCNAKNSHGQASHIIKLVQAVRPGKPTKVKGNTTCDSITLTWQPPLSNGGMRILNYVITAKNDTTEFRSRNVDEDKRIHKIDIVFKPNTSYIVRIEARNGVGVGEPETIKVLTNKYCKPGPPTISFIGGSRTIPDLTVVGPDVMVEWKPPQDNGFDENLRYRVEWRIGGKSKQAWKRSEEIQENQFEIKGLENGKHEIKVYAVNRAGKGNTDVRVVNVKSPSGNETTQEPPVVGKGRGGLSKGVIAGIVIAILLIVLITIDLFCCFFNHCGVIFCCQRACCGGKYSPDGASKKDAVEMEKLKSPPEKV